MKKSNRNIILIGGPPTIGKSTLAALVARHFDIPWISTDQIRSVMRSAANKEDHPKLFITEGYTAEKFLTKFSPEEIVDIGMEECEEVWPAIKELVENDHTWEKGFVVEGVHVLPHLANKDFKDNPQVRALFLVDEDADRIREIVYARGIWDDADTYSDDVKEREVEWAILFSHMLRDECKKYSYNPLEVKKGGDNLNLILKALSA